MHTVTFYSFKGGSGRSMALVNVAADLAKSGQNVLIVDFDLEAPGLDTFKLLSPEIPEKGLVDFVHEYLETGQSPDVREFIYESSIAEIPGKLWIMPAGMNDELYDSRFRAINWRDLYKNHDGYLLFEDLKAQWKEKFNPDYVLIDSRTGHTDMSGICTRQLPDAVLLFIFPTEQNKRGLISVVERIRAEAQGERKKEIKLHLVFANVPDLDDEESHIANSIEAVQKCLKFDSASAVIHHYSSVLLLTQPIFTIERPRTKLAREYEELTKVVRSDNLKDRIVALEFLERTLTGPGSKRLEAEKLLERLKRIEHEHQNDAEVLIQLAGVYRRFSRLDTALALLERAGERKASGSEFFLNRATLYLARGKKNEAREDLLRVLKSDDATYIEVSASTRRLLFRFPESLSVLKTTPAFERLSDENKLWLTHDLLQKREGIEIAYEILRELLQRGGGATDFRNGVLSQFELACIAAGRFKQAANLITESGSTRTDDLSIAKTFNLAAALWGLNGRPDRQLFAQVINREIASPLADANAHQCLALSHWVVGDVVAAQNRLYESVKLMNTQTQPEFSCWSYLYLSRDEFLSDTDAMFSMFRGDDIQPRFIRDNIHTTLEDAIG